MTWEERWPNFTPSEVLSPDGKKLLFTKGDLVIQPRLLDKLQVLRAHVDKPILVNHGSLKFRGYRSPAENQTIGGASQSYHTQGLAVDVTIEGMHPRDVAQVARMIGFTGIGIYETFTHLDVRHNINGRTTLFNG